eukprot:a511689_29.p1 GENE.a511689_29~~a511689_29.p1  ORF type:complete len:381 (+),score=119.45 a511689_29:50-1144(+)
MASRVGGRLGRVVIYGANSSPYAVKMRALMRYRHIPYIWKRLWIEEEGMKEQTVTPEFMPVVKYDDGQVQQGSTAIAYELERRFASLERSVIPRDQGLAFIVHLLEDFSDEWLMKATYSQRWVADDASRQFSARWAVADALTPASREHVHAQAKIYADKRVAQIPKMGCADGSFFQRVIRNVLVTMERHLNESNRFLLGSRPSLADFALYGQLSQLLIDPKPEAFMREQTPRVYAWVNAFGELSGVDGQWLTFTELESNLPQVLDVMLRKCGVMYLPYLKANAAAAAAGAPVFEIKLPGTVLVQPPLAYQTACWDETRERFRLLDPKSRARVEPLLRRTKVWGHLVDEAPHDDTPLEGFEEVVP